MEEELKNEFERLAKINDELEKRNQDITSTNIRENVTTMCKIVMTLKKFNNS